MAHLLEVRNLVTQFHVDDGVVQAVDGVSYHADEGEIVGLVGESGCGKSVSQLSVLQLIPTPPGRIVGGEVLFEGADLLKFRADGEEIRAIRGGKIGMIFQEPMTSLNPVLTVGEQIIESLVAHLKMKRSTARERAIELIKAVGIPDASQRIDNHPHQFSGGMRQRLMIAMAMACNPRLLIADEPTTALDVTVQAQLLELLQDVVTRERTSLLIVTHNLGVVARYAQRIYVMYAGRIVESGSAKDIFGNPSHPYTVGLLKSVPRLDEPKGRKLVPIGGMPPSLIDRPATCAFLPRCAHRIDRCLEQPWPELHQVKGQHYVSCFVDVEGHWAGVEAAGGSSYRLRGEARETAVVASGPGTTLVRTEERGYPKNKEAADNTLLEVRDLKMYFPVRKGVLRRKVGDVKAVNGVSFKVGRGETLGLVGESGCGKTTTGRCVLRLYRPTSGQVLLAGTDISRLSRGEVRPLRRQMSLIFQDPYGSLDPRQSAGSIVGEPLKVHHQISGKGEYRDRVDELLRMVGLDPGLADRVPHEFSGGQRQRIGIARALACDPSLIVCDEPISALDVSIQAQIINLLEELQAGRKGLSYLFIAHDLSVVRHISDRVAVMYSGRIVEITDSESLYENPLHPYTRALLSAVPVPDPYVEERRERIILRGEVPSLVNPPTGCHFHPRCPLATEQCRQVVPPLREVDLGHEAACLKV